MLYGPLWRAIDRRSTLPSGNADFVWLYSAWQAFEGVAPPPIVDPALTKIIEMA
jgi:hypothetical protein